MAFEDFMDEFAADTAALREEDWGWFNDPDFLVDWEREEAAVRAMERDWDLEAEGMREREILDREAGEPER